MCRHTQAQLHFRNEQQRAFGISNISYWRRVICCIPSQTSPTPHSLSQVCSSCCSYKNDFLHNHIKFSCFVPFCKLVIVCYCCPVIALDTVHFKCCKYYQNLRFLSRVKDQSISLSSSSLSLSFLRPEFAILYRKKV